MTVDEVRTLVAEVRSVSGDPEKAHAAEDALHQMVPEAIAAGTGAAAELAREALKTRDADFARWCA